MREEEIVVTSFQDSLEIHASIIEPDGKAKGIVQLVHGMSEHRKRDTSFMKYLASQGFVCVLHDHRGHGESVKAKEDLGYFYEHSGTYIVEDTHQITYLMKQRYPDLPYYMFGHSMGSLVARAYIKKYDYELDGLFICGSPSKNPMAFMGLCLVKILASIKGDHYRSPFVQHMAFGSYNKKFVPVQSENAWICSDEEVVKKYDEDEKCGFIFTLNGFENLFRLLRNVYDDSNWILLKKDLPIIFIAGEDDPCIGNEMKFNQAYTFLKRIGYQNVQAKLYPHVRHEIILDKSHEEVYDDVVTSIKKWQWQKNG